MKSVFRFLLVLVVAVAIGFGVYYLVQNTAGTSTFAPRNFEGNPGFRPEENQFPPQQGFENGHRPERSDRRGGFLFSLVGMLGRFIMFSLVTFAVVMVHKLIRGRPNRDRVTGTG
jgi:hypothetical protein